MKLILITAITGIIYLPVALIMLVIVALHSACQHAAKRRRTAAWRAVALTPDQRDRFEGQLEEDKWTVVHVGQTV